MKLKQFIYKYIFDLQIEQNKFIRDEEDIIDDYKYYIIDLLYLLNKKYKLYYLSQPYHSCITVRISCYIDKLSAFEIIYDFDTYIMRYYISKITFYNRISIPRNRIYFVYNNEIERDNFDARILFYEICKYMN